MRDIWANLIANEILDGNVHPEFPGILERISPAEAILIAEIGEGSKQVSISNASAAMIAALSSYFPKEIKRFVEEPKDFNHEHLARLGIIGRHGAGWNLTHFGDAFLQAVTEPVRRES